MFRTAAALAMGLILPLALVGCGQSMGASENAPPPADAPAVVDGPDYSGDLDVLGGKPAWTVEIRNDGVSLTRPGHPQVRNANPGVRLDGEQGVWDSSGAKDHEGRLVVRLTPGVCSDGLSDRVYRFVAEVWVDGETLKGCADHTDQLRGQSAP